MTKTLAILTLSGNYNYGNRLQNYAIQEVYKKFGLEVNTIWNEIGLNNGPVLTPIKRIKNFIKPLIGKTNYDKYTFKRIKTFSNFTNKYISNSSYIMKNDDNKILNSMYDYFSVGSDQVWNYTFRDLISSDFLMFADKNKTISYAPSFGVSNIPKEQEHKYIDGLKHIKHLSVREEAGKKIIEKLTGRDAQVVLDPTMLLSKEEWIKIEHKPDDLTNKKYIVTYFLDNISKEKKDTIDRLAKENNLEVINLANIYNYFDLKAYVYGPSEFLYLFNHAELILTDSFHACVFSIIFNKPFYVFDREGNMESMNSRLDTLLGLLKLTDRKVDTINGITNIFDCDYEESYKILEQEKLKSLEFIKEALK